MIKRYVKYAVIAALVTITAFFALFVGRTTSFAETVSCAASMITTEAGSGRVLYEKNADSRRPMASTTKIATAITVIDNVPDLEKTVVIPDCAVGVEGSSIYLSKGETASIRDLLYGLMLQSGNDCAVALAVTTAGSVEKFAELMNETARKCGANDTNFVTPHGLHDDNHYTTARDLAKISAYAMKNATFREIVSSKRHTMPWAGHDCDRVILNKNKILTMFDGGDGIKTGYTKKAGRCLVASATRDGMTIISVVLDCGPMFEECRNLMEKAFDEYSLVDITALAPDVKAEVRDGAKKTVTLRPTATSTYPLTKEETERLVFEEEGVKPMRGGVKRGTENGKICVTLEKRLLFESKLFTIEEVEPLPVRDILLEIAREWNG